MRNARRSRLLGILIILAAAVLLAGGPAGLGPDSAEAQQFGMFVRFAHPQEGDTIPRGESIEVIAVAVGAAPPEDLVLQYSENSGVTWTSLADQALRGRAVHGRYVPTAGQSTVVKFRTLSATPWAVSQISTFAE